MYVTAPAPAPMTRSARRPTPRRFVRSGEVAAVSRRAQLERRILDVADALDRVARGVQEAATDYDVEPQGIRMRRDTIGMLDVIAGDLEGAIETLDTLGSQPWGGHAMLLTRDMVQRPLAEMRDAFSRRGDGYSRHRSIDLQRSLVASSGASIAQGLREVVAAGA